MTRCFPTQAFVRVVVVLGLFLPMTWLFSTSPAATSPFQDERAEKLFRDTIARMGGDAFLKWTDYSATGRYFLLKKEQESWTRVWDYYLWTGKSRTDFDTQKDGLTDIFNMDLGKGWSVEYGVVKPKSPEDYQKFVQSDKRQIYRIFRDRWKEVGMKIFYYGPTNISTLKPMEALEFLDAENASVTIFYEEGDPTPSRLEYQDRSETGVALKKVESYDRWFKVQDILTPKRIEFFTNGRSTGVVEYEKFQYNTRLSPDLFGEPKPKIVKKKKKPVANDQQEEPPK